jgi:hypothetical protein
MSELSNWRPRSSSMGYYVECDYRAAFDRAIDEGLLEVTAEERSELKQGNKFTDFGTVCHFYLMDGTGCQFPGPSAEYAPTKEEEQMAAGMTGGDVELMRQKARQVATLAAAHLPKTPTGAPWLSEIPFGKEVGSPLPFSGTLDFLSPCFTELGDLKTTSRPPDKMRIKTPHLIQITAYAWLVRAVTGTLPKRGWILYVSSKGDWVIPAIPINFEAMGDFIDMVADAGRLLARAEPLPSAMPRMLDERCGDHFCAHPALPRKDSPSRRPTRRVDPQDGDPRRQDREHFREGVSHEEEGPRDGLLRSCARPQCDAPRARPDGRTHGRAVQDAQPDPREPDAGAAPTARGLQGHSELPALGRAGRVELDRAHRARRGGDPRHPFDGAGGRAGARRAGQGPEEVAMPRPKLGHITSTYSMHPGSTRCSPQRSISRDPASRKRYSRPCWRTSTGQAPRRCSAPRQSASRRRWRVRKVAIDCDLRNLYAWDSQTGKICSPRPTWMPSRSTSAASLSTSSCSR